MPGLPPAAVWSGVQRYPKRVVGKRQPAAGPSIGRCRAPPRMNSNLVGRMSEKIVPAVRRVLWANPRGSSGRAHGRRQVRLRSNRSSVKLRASHKRQRQSCKKPPPDRRHRFDDLAESGASKKPPPASAGAKRFFAPTPPGAPRVHKPVLVVVHSAPRRRATGKPLPAPCVGTLCVETENALAALVFVRRNQARRLRVVDALESPPANRKWRPRVGRLAGRSRCGRAV